MVIRHVMHEVINLIGLLLLKQLNCFSIAYSCPHNFHISFYLNMIPNKKHPFNAIVARAQIKLYTILLSAVSNACIVALISSSVCAVERNVPSNCEGGKNTPSFAISLYI